MFKFELKIFFLPLFCNVISSKVIVERQFILSHMEWTLWNLFEKWVKFLDYVLRRIFTFLLFFKKLYSCKILRGRLHSGLQQNCMVRVLALLLWSSVRWAS